MWASRFLKDRRARASAKQTATAIASAPTSRVESSANSQAFSVAVAELIDNLDFVFAQLDDEEEQGDLLRFHLLRLAKEISKDQTLMQTHSDPDLIQLLVSACRCACSVYNAKIQPGDNLMPVISRTPSAMGKVKATSIWKADATKTLFASIRGTASKADHMVNFNRDREDAGPTFTFPESSTDIAVHGGFLACANALLPWLTQEIIRQVELDDSLRHVVFTGHSAGGAVAAIVFLHFVCHCPDQLSNVDFSLVTFGSPPVTSIDITKQAQRLSRTKHIMAVVNEYDLVPRIDQTYIASIISLYRSAYETSLADPTGVVSVGKTNAQDSSGSQWELPAPDFHVVGDIVVLRAKLNLGELSSAGEGDDVVDAVPTPSLDMIQVSSSDFNRLVFFDISVHKRRIYLDRLEKILRGRITGASKEEDATMVHLATAAVEQDAPA
ncbi:hypothetical protein FZEAL_1612 [Fusarium zealandicum]|uniref:Fungal lipase-type domain-containing protein n=1 Tax=Fusarium zealandicum TaxID=1053134 RepID=A0A8H4USC9_9HYPO|nr:hypothetical protein FZEAL_1612 [Fusarium zealandicum]